MFETFLFYIISTIESNKIITRNPKVIWKEHITGVLYKNTYGFWLEIQNSNTASVTYLAQLAFHPKEWVHKMASRFAKPFLH